MFTVRTPTRQVADVLTVRNVTVRSDSTGYKDCAVGREYVSPMASTAAFDINNGRPEIPADLQDVAHGVHQEFDERLDPQLVDQCLSTVAATFADARIRSFVPLLVRRYVGEELHTRLGHT
jgi:hypothetical protein